MLHLRKAGFLIAVIGAITIPAMAQDCTNPATQLDMNQCAAIAWEAADGDLNLAYVMARDTAREMDRYAGEGHPNAEMMLRDAQRAWIAFRDLACDTESMLAYGGSMQPSLYYVCLERLTRARTEDLRYFGEVN